jgi:hypothetical protein
MRIPFIERPFRFQAEFITETWIVKRARRRAITVIWEIFDAAGGFSSFFWSFTSLIPRPNSFNKKKSNHHSSLLDTIRHAFQIADRRSKISSIASRRQKASLNA